MLIWYFFVFLVISLIIVGLGLFSNDTVMMISGFTFIFLLGMFMIVGGVTYQSGTLLVGNYTTYNGEPWETIEEYPMLTPFSFGDTTRYIGFFLTIMGAFGFVGAFTRYNESRKDKDGDYYD